MVGRITTSLRDFPYQKRMPDNNRMFAVLYNITLKQLLLVIEFEIPNKSSTTPFKHSPTPVFHHNHVRT
jgi:hypothetical protein